MEFFEEGECWLVCFFSFPDAKSGSLIWNTRYTYQGFVSNVRIHVLWIWPIVHGFCSDAVAANETRLLFTTKRAEYYIFTLLLLGCSKIPSDFIWISDGGCDAIRILDVGWMILKFRMIEQQPLWSRTNRSHRLYR